MAPQSIAKGKWILGSSSCHCCYSCTSPTGHSRRTELRLFSLPSGCCAADFWLSFSIPHLVVAQITPSWRASPELGHQEHRKEVGEWDAVVAKFCARRAPGSRTSSTAAVRWKPCLFIIVFGGEFMASSQHLLFYRESVGGAGCGGR